MQSGRAILVVDDDEQVLELTAAMLEVFGFPILTANSPESARLLWEEHKADIWVLVTDFVMPGTSGDQLALEFSSDKPSLKILVISGNDPENLESELPLRCGDNFLRKPFSAQTLRARVHAALTLSA